MERADLIALAKSIANTHQLFPDIVCGICDMESTWEPQAYRYEPIFYTRYVEPEFNDGKISATEARARAFSWGIMQVMGQSAREIGYIDRFTVLCDPAVGIEWGCRLFTVKLQHAGGNYAKALTLWNGGADLSYSPAVLKLAQNYL